MKQTTKFLKPIYSDLSRHSYLYLILLLLALLMGLTLHADNGGADGRNYLRWTHSFVFDQDLHLLNNAEATGGSYKLTPTGFVFERVNIGAALLWSPFYGAAALFLPTPAPAEPYPGEEIIQQLWINFSSWFYTITAGILTVAALRSLFAPRPVWAATLAVLFGTPVLFYMMSFPMSAHPSLLFLSALLLYLWLAYRPEKPVLHRLTIGVVIGWLMLAASYNIVFFVLPGIDLLRDYIETKNGRAVSLNGLAVALGGLLGFLPQMMVWWFLFGSPFYSPYSAQLLWSEPYLMETLFSTFHGLFFYAPVLLLAIPGLWRWRQHDGWQALSIGLVWLTLAYLASTNVAWWAGASFGNRYFLSLSPFFVFSLAAFIDKNDRWANLLVLACVVWAVGFYLQFLSGVPFISDSVILPAAELAWGQVTAWTNSVTILPRLLWDRPWSFVPALTWPIFSLLLIAGGRLVYGWATRSAGEAGHSLRYVITASSLTIILFVAAAGFRGTQTVTALARAGFYDQPHETIRYEVKELAGEAGLVTRALYHEQTGQAKKAIADLTLASERWKEDPTGQPTRLYLGPKNSAPAELPLSLHLDYPGNVRLVGYELLEVNQTFISGHLFWEKLAGEKSRDVIQPLLRGYDQHGSLLGSVTLDFPFPAYYLPPGSLFQDSFRFEYDSPPDGWAWLAVSIAEDSRLPMNAQGEPDNGIISVINVNAFPPPPLITGEPPQRLVGMPGLLLGYNYQAGETIPIQITWQDYGNATEDFNLDMTLLDPDQQPAGSWSYPIQPSAAATWATSKVQVETFCFSLPPVISGDDYQLVFDFESETAGVLVDHNGRPVQRLVLPLHLTPADGVLTGSICDLIQDKFPRRFEPSSPVHPLDVLFTNEIKLSGYDLSIIPQSESVLASIILHWTAQANIKQDYQVLLQLLDARTGLAVIEHTGSPQHDQRPTSTWLQDEWILDEHVLTVPALPPGIYDLDLTLLDEETGRPVFNSRGQAALTLQEIQIP